MHTYQMIPDTHFRAVIDIWSKRREQAYCTISGSCMSPIINDGDSLLIKYGKNNIYVGDVLVYGTPGKLYAHRVLKIEHREGNDVFLLKADRSYSFDQPVTSEQVLGKVIEVRGSNGHLIFNSFFWRYLNYILSTYSYISGNRLNACSPLWKGVDFLFILRSKILPERYSISFFMWRVICRFCKMWFRVQQFFSNRRMEAYDK